MQISKIQGFKITGIFILGLLLLLVFYFSLLSFNKTQYQDSNQVNSYIVDSYLQPTSSPVKEFSKRLRQPYLDGGYGDDYYDVKLASDKPIELIDNSLAEFTFSYQGRELLDLLLSFESVGTSFNSASFEVGSFGSSEFGIVSRVKFSARAEQYYIYSNNLKSGEECFFFNDGDGVCGNFALFHPKNDAVLEIRCYARDQVEIAICDEILSRLELEEVIF